MTIVFKKALALLPMLLVTVAPAQELTADEVLANIKAEAESVADATFLLTGRLIDPDGTQIALEVEVEVMPEERAARAMFLQPDALADNVIVFDREAVYNYIYLTNQVTIFDANDPDALGGLLSGAEDGAGFDLTLDLDRLFAGWETEVLDYQEGSYRLRFDNREEGATLHHVVAVVREDGWVPSQLELYGEGDNLMAELFVEEFERDRGLSREDVTYIPDDAEVIDERD